MNPEEEKERLRWEGYGDSGVISIPAGFRRHLVGKTLISVNYHCDIAEIRSVGKLVIIPTDISIKPSYRVVLNFI